ncbi:1,2-phenylacetyl-CoA epoxidase subunit PaaC [Kitasatospora sp. NPDC015120]|uniref:1,2-phenylacetyl-CoA epoxidase subunit PaaC n=1 Tax=Kitasatospora sp. NPDC015120 TaxID=3364023 RepID=UPI0036F48BE8
MSDDHVYPTLDDGSSSDAQWAFGTGFEDPLHGVDTTLPAGVDGAELAAYCLALGDDALVLAQRLAQWCTLAPELEEELALANIGLDLLGQARLLYTRAGQADGTGRTEDDFAYWREAHEFSCVQLAELPGGDFAFSMARLTAFATWRLALFERLTGAVDPLLAAVAAKGVKELAYHRQYAARWVVRLGDGTDVSREKMQRALDEVWPHLGELFASHPTERRAVAGGFGVDPGELRREVEATLREVVDAAGLTVPPIGEAEALGRDGGHTEALGVLLDELQSVARAHPGASW